MYRILYLVSFQISENFYFDLNTDPMKKMISLHVPYEDTSTISKAGIFSITYPSPDVFLVIKVSLQECHYNIGWMNDIEVLHLIEQTF